MKRLACASNRVSGWKRVSQPQITKDRFSHVMAFPWSSDRRWQSTGIWFYIDCHYHNSLTPSYIGSELTRKGVCEQAEHVMSPQGIRRMMKTRTNQPMQKYRCSSKAFKWSKHSQKRKLWVFLQYEGREMYYSDSWEFCVPVVHISYLEVAIFIFSFHSKSMSVRVRLNCRTECTYMYCLVYFYAAFSRVLWK